MTLFNKLISKIIQNKMDLSFSNVEYKSKMFKVKQAGMRSYLVLAIDAKKACAIFHCTECDMTK